MTWLVILLIVVLGLLVPLMRAVINRPKKWSRIDTTWCKDGCVSQKECVTGVGSIDNSEILERVANPLNIPRSSMPKHLEYMLSPGSGQLSEMEYAECLIHAKDFESINFNDPIHIYDAGGTGDWRDYRDSKGRFIKKALAIQLEECSDMYDINYVLLDNTFYILHNYKMLY